MTRGVPGTHDYKLINDFLEKLKIKNSNLLVYQNLINLLMIDAKEINGIK